MFILMKAVLCAPTPAAGQDASERGRHRVRQRARLSAVEQRGGLRVLPAAHPGGGAGARGGPPLEAPVQGAAGGRRGGSGVEEGALLPGAALLAGLAGHARHLHRHRGDEPPAGRDPAPVVAEDAVLPAAARQWGARRGPRWGHTAVIKEKTTFLYESCV